MTTDEIRERLGRYRREKISAETSIPITRLKTIFTGTAPTYGEGQLLAALFNRWEGRTDAT